MSEHFHNLRQKIGTTLLQIPGVAAVIHDETGRILLHKAVENSYWSLPAGAIEPGELPAEALVREVREETGLKVRPQNIVGVFGGNNFRHVYSNGDRVEYMVVVFKCKVLGGILSNQNDETLDLQYFKLDEMPKLAVEYPKIILDIDAEEAYFDWKEKYKEQKYQ